MWPRGFRLSGQSVKSPVGGAVVKKGAFEEFADGNDRKSGRRDEEKKKSSRSEHDDTRRVARRVSPVARLPVRLETTSSLLFDFTDVMTSGGGSLES